MSLVLDIKKHYPGFMLDMQLEAGEERVALLGASGCGKSCTLRCIAGVETPDEGKIVVNGVTFFDSAAGINLSPQERKCALLFQNYQLFPNMTVADNVCAGVKDAGDAAARQEMIEGNLRLVLSVVQRFTQRGENLDDLFQVGCIGLIKAIDNFDPAQNVRFSTYGVPMIIGEIRRFLRDNNSIRVSRSLRDTAYKAIYAREMLLKKNQKEPSITEVASEVGISREDIVYALDAIQNPMSLYEPIFTDGGDTLYVMDQIRDKKNREENWVEHLSLSDALKKLNAREHEIISLRFFEGKTQMEVAELIGISQAQVSRLEKNALRIMRAYLSA